MAFDDHAANLMRYVDGEMRPEERAAFEEHLKTCPECTAQLRDMTALKEVTDTMKIADLPETVWEKYWTGVYNQIERSVAWVLFIAGSLILIGYWFYRVITDPGLYNIVGLGFMLMLFGFLVLLLSVIREKHAVNRVDRYISEVKR